jgi:hypothetical protein
MLLNATSCVDLMNMPLGNGINKWKFCYTASCAEKFSIKANLHKTQGFFGFVRRDSQTIKDSVLQTTKF